MAAQATTAAQAKKPVYKLKVFCKVCDRGYPDLDTDTRTCAKCLRDQGKENSSALRAAKRQDRLRRESEKLNRQVERQLENKTPTRTRRPSDASSVFSESTTLTSSSSQCWSVSTAATLTLSKDEEMEARKLEAQLRKIDSLQERKSEGKPLTKWEESEIRRKPHITFAPVMVKVQNGATRWTLDTVPLTKDEDEQVQSAERKLHAIKLLEDRKARGEWLTMQELAELTRKPTLESSPLMMRVREGAPRYREQRSVVAAAPASPAPVRAPAPKAPAPAPARIPVPETSAAQLSVATPTLASSVLPTEAPQDDAVSSSSEVSTKAQEPTLKYMVATIRAELELEDSLTMSQVVAEANRQLGQLAMPAAGSLIQQARHVFSQLTSA